MISEQDANLILEPVIEGVMAGYDVRVGLTEQRFHQLVGLFNGNEKADCAWFEVTEAINDM